MLFTKLNRSVFVILALGSLGAANQETTRERVDPQGDPLPHHALFRVGTTRLQHEGPVQTLAVSEDGRFLASHGRDKKVRVWDAKDGKQIWTFDLHTTEPWALAFSRDNKQLAAVSKSYGAFRRWDLTTGREMPNGRDHPAVDIRSVFSVYHVALACSDGGEFLAAETDKADIILYSPGVAASGRRLKGHAGPVMSVCFTKDAKTLVSLSDDGMIFWNTADGKAIAQWPAPLMKDQSLKGSLAAIAVSPDGKKLALSLSDASTRLLKSSGQELRRLPTSEQMNALAFSPNGKSLFTGGNWIDAWKADDAEPIAIVNQVRSPLRALSLSPDGKLAACTDQRDRLRLVEIGTGKILLDREMSCRGGIAFAPQGKLLALAPGDNTIALWEVAALGASEKPIRSDPAILLRCEGKVDAFVFAPDGKRLATVEGRVSRIYDIASKQVAHTLTPSGRTLFALAFSADGKLLATMGSGRSVFQGALAPIAVPQTVGLWDSFTGKEFAIGEELQQIAHTVVFHPNGKSLAALHLPVIAKNAFRSSRDNPIPPTPVEDRMETIRLWDASLSRERFRFEDPVHRKSAEHANGWIIGRSQAVAAAFSPDGRLFAIPGPGDIVLFETASGQPRLRLRGHLGGVTALAFTPDGKTLVSASRDATLMIWDVTGLRTGAKRPGPSDDLWALLADADAERAGRAVFAMVDAPADALAMIRERLRPVSVSADRVQKLVADLDHSSFTVRHKAARDLAALGPGAQSALTRKLQATPSLEASRRISELLAAINSERPGTDHLRTIRAVEVLDRIGSAEAIALLRELAAGTDGVYVTTHAREALDRRRR